MTAERILISVPGVEDLTVVAAMLRAAGAAITAGRRTFAVEGALTAAQAAAVWRMREHVDSGSEGNQLDVRVEPDGDLEQALDRLCPDGWSPGDYDDCHDDDQYGNDDWWVGQQRVQVERARTAAPPPASVVQVERRADGACCGRRRPVGAGRGLAAGGWLPTVSTIGHLLAVYRRQPDGIAPPWPPLPPSTGRSPLTASSCGCPTTRRTAAGCTALSAPASNRCGTNPAAGG